ncbi:MAG: J domain-containing protein [Patescibacteria group bacterium]
MDEESENYNPTQRETRTELESQEQIRYRIGNLLRELQKKKTTPHNPFRSHDDEYDLFEEDSIQNPEGLLMDVDDLIRDIKYLKDREARQTLLQRLEGLEEKVIEHYEPFIHQRVDNAGAEIFYTARHEPEQKQTHAGRTTLRTETEIHEALEIIKLWRLPEDTRIKLSAILELEQQRLEGYQAEPFLYGFEQQLDNVWETIRKEKETIYVERRTSRQMLGREEEYLQTSEFLKSDVSMLEELLDHITRDEVRRQCTDDLRGVHETLTYLEQAKKEVLKNLKPRQPSENLEPRDWALSVLGLAKTATMEDAKSAYRSLVLEHHPDKVPEAHWTTANKKMAEINRAYSILNRNKDSI